MKLVVATAHHQTGYKAQDQDFHITLRGSVALGRERRLGLKRARLALVGDMNDALVLEPCAPSRDSLADKD